MPAHYGREWFKVRARHLRLNPRCQVCGAKASAVDHIQTVRVRPDLKLDPSNLQSLCDHHHSMLTQLFDKPGASLGCDLQGLPIDPRHPWHTGHSTEVEPDPRDRARAKLQAIRHARR
jgi:5-methylcytosine-specific restriction protein A